MNVAGLQESMNRKCPSVYVTRPKNTIRPFNDDVTVNLDKLEDLHALYILEPQLNFITKIIGLSLGARVGHLVNSNYMHTVKKSLRSTTFIWLIFSLTVGI